MSGLSRALLFCFAALAAPAEARTVSCLANMDGIKTELAFDTASTDYRSLRERWSPLAPECPADAVLAKLLPHVAATRRAEFCLITDPDSGANLAAVRGDGDRYGRCKETGKVCKAVNSARDATVRTVVKVGQTFVGTQETLRNAGLPTLDVPTGVLILSEASGAIAGTLESASATSAGAGTVGTVSAPAALVGAAAGAVVIGGALLICAD